MPIVVSVIIAAYNVERYIERAIRSALAQKGPEVEVIVVDDNSTDGTGARISAIADSRLKTIRLPKNCGPGVARNAGMAKASGSWIAILDADDSFQPGRLRRCIERVDRENADIVVDNLMVFRESDKAAFPMFPPARFSRISRLGLADFIAGNQSFLGGYALGYLKPVFSAEFLRRNGLAYRPRIKIGEDYLLMAEALACGARCAVEPSIGYRYTSRANSVSHRLTRADVMRIAACDRDFLSAYKLDSAAATALRTRGFRLKEAYAFTRLVEALKKKDMMGAGKAFVAAPLASRHLWRPALTRARSFFLFLKNANMKGANHAHRNLAA